MATEGACRPGSHLGGLLIGLAQTSLDLFAILICVIADNVIIELSLVLFLCGLWMYLVADWHLVMCSTKVYIMKKIKNIYPAG
jgi:hypothetical protein